MSELIWVWNPAGHATVRSVAAAGALIDTLSGQLEDAPDAQVQAFVAALTQEYPTSAMQPDEDSVWQTEDLLAYGRQPSAALSFGLPSTSDAMAVMGSILVHAAAAGVAVYDPQRSWVWLPDGKAYPADAKDARKTLVALASAPRATAPGWKQLAKLMHLELDPFLLAAGFEDRTRYPLEKLWSHGEYSRPLEGGAQEISFGLSRMRQYGHPDDDRWVCEVAALVRFDCITEAHRIHWEKDERGHVRMPHHGTAAWTPLQFFLGIRGPKTWRTLTYAICVEDAPGRQKIRDTLLHSILPFLDEARTVCDVDRLINRDGHPMADLHGRSTAQLMVAKWCGNPRYEELCHKYIAAVGRFPDSQRLREEEVRIINTFEQRYPTPADTGSKPGDGA